MGEGGGCFGVGKSKNALCMVRDSMGTWKERRRDRRDKRDRRDRREETRTN